MVIGTCDTRRSLMPVRVVIHSSVVSMKLARPALSSTAGGMHLPQPVMAACVMAGHDTPGPGRGLYWPAPPDCDVGIAVKEQRKIVPPVYMLFALLAMVGLHYAIPLARIVAQPVSYLGLIPLFVGITIAATAARMFDRAGTPSARSSAPPRSSPAGCIATRAIRCTSG